MSLTRALCAASLAALLALLGCGRSRTEPGPQRPQVSILLVTLDTTRADAIGPEAAGVVTPSFDALARRGRRFRQAYTPVPQTLAAHASMMTGLYPAGHGVHENGRYLSDRIPLVAEQLKRSGYRTAAFVSAFALARRFGLARGFDTYDDDFGAGVERRANETTDRVLAYLGHPSPPQPLFLWVHYYDPHYPYDPPEPFRSQYAGKPYLGEVAFMDQQLGRLVAAFEGHGGRAVIVAGDHGEGLGDHGEAQHGDLLYQATMHVPLLLLGPGVTAGVRDDPVSTRRVFHTILDWAGLEATNSLRRGDREVVVGEAMKPFLDYGWQPEVMAVEGNQKTILAGRIEVYDLLRDPGETHDLSQQAILSRDVRSALREYPIPSAGAAQLPPNATEEERKKLASLGYVSSGTRPVIRADAPRPVDMARLFPILDEAAALFVQEKYAAAIPLLRKILAKDPHNLDAALRLATCYSSLGRNSEALAAFQRAEAIDPSSEDVRTYLALHYARGREWQKAIPLLERVVSDDPDRLPALEALAVIRERQGRIDEAAHLREKIYTARQPSSAELVRLGEMEMSLGHTAEAIDAFEKAHSNHELELGVLYLAAGRLEQARESLDRVPPSNPGYPMALFKRAQVAVLLHEPDAVTRIDVARRHADATTRALIERERLFRR